MTKKIDLSSFFGLPSLTSDSGDAIASLLWARKAIQEHLKLSYSVQDSEGIEELFPLQVCGIEQWIHIRGRNRNNPVLLFVHGGPASGGGWIGTMDAVQRPWEDYFTVVQWDQRGMGKSDCVANEKTDASVDRIIEDANQVVRYLRRYLKQEKIFVLGHSWGSVTAMHMIKCHPDWYYAYVGVAQVVSMMEGERVLFQRLKSRATEKSDEKLLKKLTTIFPYPNPENLGKSFAENHLFVRRELSRLAGEAMARHWGFEQIRNILSFELLISPHLSLDDHVHSLLAHTPTLVRPPYHLAEQVMKVDLPKDVGSKFQTPIFFFTGSHDWHSPRVLSDDWFSQIEAPHKELIHFENSCHFIFNEEPGKMLVELVNKVLPFRESCSQQECYSA